jgi:hypothetical protein
LDNLNAESCRWEDNINIDLKNFGYEGMDRMHVAKVTDQLQAVVNTVMNLRVP